MLEQHKWINKLHDYEFDIIYLARAQNTQVDTFSWLHEDEFPVHCSSQYPNQKQQS